MRCYSRSVGRHENCLFCPWFWHGVTYRVDVSLDARIQFGGRTRHVVVIRARKKNIREDSAGTKLVLLNLLEFLNLITFEKSSPFSIHQAGCLWIEREISITRMSTTIVSIVERIFS